MNLKPIDPILFDLQSSEEQSILANIKYEKD